MKNLLDRYLDRVLIYANKPETESAPVRQELKDHLLQKIDDLTASGFSREEAMLEALHRHGSPRVIGYGLRGPFPWIDIRSHGTARGVIAIGPKAVGIFAFGGVAVGVIACGGAAIGVFSAGGLALGLLFAWAGLGIGTVANAALAIGIVAAGGLAIGVVSAGRQAIGAWTPTLDGDYVVHQHAAENVPPLIRSLESVLNGALVMDKYMFTFVLPGYLLFVFTLSYLRYREGQRVSADDDWLIDD